MTNLPTNISSEKNPTQGSPNLNAPKGTDDDVWMAIWGILIALLSMPLLAILIFWLNIYAALVFPFAFFAMAVLMMFLVQHVKEYVGWYAFILVIALALAGLLATSVWDTQTPASVTNHAEAAKKGGKQ